MYNPFDKPSLKAVEPLVTVIDEEPLTDDTLDAVAAQIYALDTQIKELTEQRDLLKQNLLARFETDGLKNYETRFFKVWCQASARKVKLKVEPELLPEQYRVLKADEKAIRQALDDGEDMSAYAELEPATQFIRINPKKR